MLGEKYKYETVASVDAYLLFDHKKSLGGRKWQLLHRVLLHDHVCAPLIANLKITATLEKARWSSGFQTNNYVHKHTERESPAGRFALSELLHIQTERKAYMSKNELRRRNNFKHAQSLAYCAGLGGVRSPGGGTQLSSLRSGELKQFVSNE